MRNLLGYGSIFSNEARQATLGSRAVRIFGATGLALGGLVMLAGLYLLIGQPKSGGVQTWLNALASLIFFYGAIGVLVAFCVVSILRVKAQTNQTLLRTIAAVALKVFLYLIVPAIIIALLIIWLVPRQA